MIKKTIRYKRIYYIFLFLFIILGLLFFPTILEAILPLITNQDLCEMIEECICYKEAYYGVTFVSLTSIILFSCNKREQKCHMVLHYIREYRPHLKMSLIVDPLKNDYEVFVKDLEQTKKVHNIQLFIHSDEQDLAEFTHKKQKFEELNQIRQEKLLYEMECKIKDGKKPNDEESKVIKDFQIKLSTLNIDAFIKNTFRYKMLILKIENVGNNMADQIKFYSKYVDAFKQACIITGEDASKFVSMKKSEEIYIRVLFLMEKIKGTLNSLFTIKIY